MKTILIILIILIVLGVLAYKFCKCSDDNNITPYYCETDEENIVGKI
jgi:uncharacterized protein YxeA